MVNDVLAEFEGHHPPSPDELQWLRSRVSVRGLALTWTGTISLIRAADVVELDGGRFEFGRYMPGRQTTRAFLLDAADEAGDVIDIIAFGAGSFVATWLGKAAFLGADFILAPRLYPTVPVRSSPIKWLAADRYGVVVVDPDRAADALQGYTLVAEDVAHARSLKRMLTPPPPKVLLPAQARAAA